MNQRTNIKDASMYSIDIDELNNQHFWKNKLRQCLKKLHITLQIGTYKSRIGWPSYNC